MTRTPQPASPVTVAQTASAARTTAVQPVATIAAARPRALADDAAIADATTNSGTSTAATTIGSSEPRVSVRMPGTVATVIHQTAPPRACSAK